MSLFVPADYPASAPAAESLLELYRIGLALFLKPCPWGALLLTFIFFFFFAASFGLFAQVAAAYAVLAAQACASGQPVAVSQLLHAWAAAAAEATG